MKRFLVIAALVAIFVLANRFFEVESETISILAGSELKDVKPMLDEIRRETGVEIEFHFTGTLDGAETLASESQYDMGWFSHAKYLSLLEGRVNKKIIYGSEKLMLSPVIAGVKKSVADQWGWCENPAVSWKEFSDKAASGELSYAMTNPASSNSGFSATVGVQSALAGGEALQPDMIDSEAMLGFAKGHKLTSGSSGWLADKYLAEQSRVDAIFNYESVLIGLNQSGRLLEPLCLIYPPEGVVTADYPLLLLNKNKQEAFNKLVEYFKRNEVQERLLTYLDKQRAPTTSIFVLDVSGSMEGDRLRDLKQAMFNLAGADKSITGMFARFRSREQVVIQPFSGQPFPPETFVIQSGTGSDPELKKLRNKIESLKANGGTAIYSSLAQAYQIAVKAKKEDPDRFYSIVLMSDGANTSGIDLRRFEEIYRTKHDEFASIPTFPVIFGKAETEEMHHLADLTGGRAFDSRKHSLSVVFKKIRGYQ